MSTLLQRMEFLDTASLQTDAGQPRTDYAIDGDKNHLKVSMKEIGVLSPLHVIEAPEKDGRYLIVDGHRRYLCAKSLRIEKVPCIVYDEMHKNDLDRVRYEIQNNRRTWRPVERATALESIQEAGKYKTMGDLAKAVHMSESAIDNYFLLKKQNLRFLALWQRYDLSASFQHQFVRLMPKLKRVEDAEIEEIVVTILEKIKQNVITNSKDLSKLGSAFRRFSQNEPYIKEFLLKPTMTVRELTHTTLLNGLSLNIEEIANAVKEKLATGKQFSPGERKSLGALKILLQDAI